MAFTGAERARILSLGGWGSRWAQSTNQRIKSALDAIDLGYPDEEALIRSYLEKLTNIDALVEEAHGMVGVKQTGSVIMDDTAGVAGLRSEGARYVDAIYRILECDVIANFYRSGAPQGGPIRYG
jgi:hypothetical protein